MSARDQASTTSSTGNAGPAANQWISELRRRRLIAAVHTLDEVRFALSHDVRSIFVLADDLFALRAIVRECQGQRTWVFAHADRLEGIGKDPVGMRLLAQEEHVSGVVTTRAQLIRAAQVEGLIAVQPFFLLDSDALRSGLRALEQSRPDVVTLLPAMVVPSIVSLLPFDTLPPAIAGGLVRTPDNLLAVWQTPVLAVATSARTLWVIRPPEPTG